MNFPVRNTGPFALARGHVVAGAVFACASLVFASLPAPGSAAWSNDPLSPQVIHSGPGTRFVNAAIPDGAGGFYVAWTDDRSGNSDVYVQRVRADGTMLWTPGGQPVATGSASQFNPQLIGDGAGGVIVAWIQFTTVDAIHAQRLTASGTPLWTAGGVRVATQPNAQVSPFGLAPDGGGGAYFAWTYRFSGTDFDTYAHHLNAAGAQLLSPTGVGIATATSMQNDVTGVSDGVGGFWIVWRDNSTSTDDLFAQRLTAAGAPVFGAGGIAVESFPPGAIQHLSVIADGTSGFIAAFTQVQGATTEVNSVHVYPQLASVSSNVTGGLVGEQSQPRIASDGAGGAYVAWYDARSEVFGDVYGTHLSSIGLADPNWAQYGEPIAARTGVIQQPGGLVADGQGGLIATWIEAAFGSGAILKARRYRPDSTNPPGWDFFGNIVMAKPGGVATFVTAPTGTGGAFVAWVDPSLTPIHSLNARRIDAFGQIGTPEPIITSVRDVPNDQGGRLRVTWSASPLDRELQPVVNGYQVWRQVPPNVALAAKRSGRGSMLREIPNAVSTTWWEFAGGVTAQRFPGYSLVIDTESDSIATSNPRTQVMVEAVDFFNAPGPTLPGQYWNSPPDSGYSVDNLPPAIPAGLAATWSSGGSTLYWNANGEADLAGYRVYRGTSAGFVPSPANLVASPAQSWLVDSGVTPHWYRVSAVDIHGNESGSALVLPSGAVGAGDDPPREMAFVIASGNPLRGRGSVAMRVDLPEAAPVSVSVFDAAGRRVRDLVDEPLRPGRWPITWRGDLADGGHASAGVYFVRAHVGSRSFSKRLVLTP